MTKDKRYRTESIEGLTSWFIVDELSAKKKSDNITSFKAYDTHSKRKCDELTDLLNNYVEENEQLKSDLDYFQRTYEIEERGLDIVAPMCTIGSPTPSRFELFKENVQLKHRIKKLQNELNNCEEDYILEEYL